MHGKQEKRDMTPRTVWEERYDIVRQGNVFGMFGINWLARKIKHFGVFEKVNFHVMWHTLLFDRCKNPVKCFIGFDLMGKMSCYMK